MPLYVSAVGATLINCGIVEIVFIFTPLGIISDGYKFCSCFTHFLSKLPELEFLTFCSNSVYVFLTKIN